MANQQTNQNPDLDKPGSSLEAARAQGGKGDFGVEESDVINRTYTSMNTKRSDPGAAVARSSPDEGNRVTGAGGNQSGPGSSSGGDLDPDIVGVGTGAGVSASGQVDEPSGPDDAQQTSSRTGKRVSAMPAVPNGSTVQLPDDRSQGEGADSVSRMDAEEDAFVGEVSSDEASGRNDARG